MSDPVLTPFRTRAFTIAADVGFPTGLGVRGSYSPIPELGIELHASTILLLQTYGADVTYRPLAGAFSVSPFVRVGVSALQSNMEAFGGPAWQPMGTAQLGVEWRTRGGFSLGGGIGAAVVAPDGHVGVIPSANLSIGYAF
jgi:hypothetical protein